MKENGKISFKRQARILAFQAVYTNSINPQPIEDLLMFSWTASIPPHVYRFARELTSKTIENNEIITKILIDNMNNPKFEDISELEKSILKISVCQLLYFKKTQPAIIIDEAIELAKSFGGKNSYRLIHAILDSIHHFIQESK